MSEQNREIVPNQILVLANGPLPEPIVLDDGPRVYTLTLLSEMDIGSLTKNDPQIHQPVAFSVPITNGQRSGRIAIDTPTAPQENIESLRLYHIDTPDMVATSSQYEIKLSLSAAHSQAISCIADNEKLRLMQHDWETGPAGGIIQVVEDAHFNPFTESPRFQWALNQIDLNSNSYGKGNNIDVIVIDGFSEDYWGAGKDLAITGFETYTIPDANSLMGKLSNLDFNKFASELQSTNPSGSRPSELPLALAENSLAPSTSSELLPDPFAEKLHPSTHGHLVSNIIHSIASSSIITAFRAFNSNGDSTSESVAKNLFEAVKIGKGMAYPKRLVVNMSFVYTSPVSCVETAITRMLEIGAMDHDIVFVGAAGNMPEIEATRRLTSAYPANSPYVLSIAASNGNYNISSYSHSSSDSLMAPGGDEDGLMSLGIKVAEDKYDIYKTAGTSFATPVASGAIAAILSKYPDYSLSQLRSTLQQASKWNKGIITLRDIQNNRNQQRIDQRYMMYLPVIR
ncbi:MAG: S8/S53 family peptidase [Chloroflexota bacterium]